MFSNKALDQVADDTSGAPLTGMQIQNALLDPSSALYKDLYNARMNAEARKINREHAEFDFILQQDRELAIAKLENELAVYRNKSAANYRENIEKYYAEQRALAQQDAVLSTNSQEALFHASLNSLSQATQELCITQSMLVSTESERKTLLDRYADNQKTCAKQFQSLNSNTTYTADNVDYCLNTDLLTFEQLKKAMTDDQLKEIPNGKEQEYLEQRKEMLKEKQKETANTLSKQKPFTEVIMALPEEDDVRQLFEKGMIDNRPLLQRNVLIEIALTNFVRAFLCEIIAEKDARQVNRTSSHLVKQKFTELKPLYDKSQELDVELHINCKNRLKLLERQAMLQAEINQSLQDLHSSYFITSDSQKTKLIDDVMTLNNINNNRRGPVLLFR